MADSQSTDSEKVSVTRRAEVMDAEQITRAIKRMAHEVIERNGSLKDLVLVGLQAGGVWLSDRLGQVLSEIEGETATTGMMDVTFYRDDVGLSPLRAEKPTVLPDDVTGMTVVLVDDVLYTGRTIRAALDVIADYGRPKSVQLAVMVDRGHREMPIRADFVGKNLPTSRLESVEVGPNGVFITEKTEIAGANSTPNSSRPANKTPR